MTTDPQGRLATRAELYNLASTHCLMIFLAVIAADGGLMATYVMTVAVGMSFYFGMKARWVTNADPRQAGLAAILDSARADRLAIEAREPGTSKEARDQQLKLIADLQSQLVQLRRKVEGF